MSGDRAATAFLRTDAGLGVIARRQLVPISIIVLGLWFFSDRLPHLDLIAIKPAFARIGNLQWGLALAATAVSFCAVGWYDDVIHGLLATGIRTRAARLSGTISIAIAQFTGFGVITGALVRWRLLDRLSLWQATRISAAVSVSFLAGWATLTALAVMFAAPRFSVSIWLSLAALAGLGLAIILYRHLQRHIPRLIPVRAMAMILLLVAIDLGGMAIALFQLLPADFQISPAVFVSAFLLAVGAGLIGGTPGGIGPFEVTLISLLPDVPAEPLLVSVLAFRLIYYLLPAALATVALVYGRLGTLASDRPYLSQPPGTAQLTPALELRLWHADRADANLLRQGDFCTMINGRLTVALLCRQGQSLVMLGAPLQAARQYCVVLQQVAELARACRLGAIIYKCPARMAVVARRLGWSVTRVVQEAWLRPANYSTRGPARRQLRRMLRKADTAGITVVEAGCDLPLEDMRLVSAAWAAAHGGERGFSTGRFADDYIKCQRVFIAYNRENMVAFITLHESRDEWSLDLMRYLPGLPHGTMHMLVNTAIIGAAKTRINKFSLAAVPCNCDCDDPITNALRRRILMQSNADGLRRFKNSFAPIWSTHYAIAPSRLSLALGMIEVLRAIKKSVAI